MHRIYLAFLCFFRVLFGKALPAELLPAPPAPSLPALSSAPLTGRQGMRKGEAPLPATGTPPSAIEASLASLRAELAALKLAKPASRPAPPTGEEAAFVTAQVKPRKGSERPLLKSERAVVPEKPAKPAPPDPAGGALLLLGLLQREGRLVDFLSESIDAYDDADIGAAVRDIHRGCKKVLTEHFGVEPILDGDENEPITVDAGFDPLRVRLTGNVGSTAPFRGTLRHHGWRAARIKLPTVTEGLDAAVVAPAEVELP